MLKFKMKLHQLPVGAKFVLNGVVFVRGEFLESKDAYKCHSMKSDIIVYLSKFTNVEPEQEII